MKLLSKQVNKDGGHVTLVPELAEDLWHAYQLISVGDFVKTATFRKVVLNEGGSGEGTSTNRTSKVKTVLNIQVENIDFTPEGGELRLRGKNVEENEYVKIGSYHTLDIEVNRKFTLSKLEWDSISIEAVKAATNPKTSADIAAVVMHEGLANLCLITAAMTIPQCKVEVNIPKKRRNNNANYDKATAKFFDNVALAITRHVDFSLSDEPECQSPQVSS